jgi:GntP family gluconate:H+ symporter
VAIPMLAGLSTTHGLIPPHPGPLAAIERLGADPGRTLFYALIVGFPVAVLSGPLFGRLISRRIHISAGAMADQLSGASANAQPPSLPITIFTMLLPVLLMLAAALAQGVLPDGTMRRVFAFVGTPLMAMLMATLVALLTFGRACGFNRARLLQFAEESLTPIASVLLVVGA